MRFLAPVTVTLFLSLFLVQPTEAQLLKKLFGKKDKSTQTQPQTSSRTSTPQRSSASSSSSSGSSRSSSSSASYKSSYDSAFVAPKKGAVRTSSSQFTIAAVGDILLHTRLQMYGQAVKNKGGFENVWKEVAHFLANADFTLGNLEGPIAPGLAAQTQQKSFNFPEFIARDLKNAGFDVITTANNHSADRGHEGAKRNVHYLEKHGLQVTGTMGRDVARYRAGDVNVAVIGCNRVIGSDGRTSYPRTSYVRDCTEVGPIIRAVKEAGDSDLIIVYPHWGWEKEESANSGVKSLAKSFFENGADLVVGAHPHVFQDYDFYEIKDVFGDTKKRLVIYSLGNFISNQVYSSFKIGQKTSAVALVHFHWVDGELEAQDFEMIPLLCLRSGDSFALRTVGPNSPSYRYLESKYGSKRMR